MHVGTHTGKMACAEQRLQVTNRRELVLTRETKLFCGTFTVETGAIVCSP